LGLSHRFIRRRGCDVRKLAEFDKHTMHQCVDADRGFYAHGQWDEFPPEALVLRGLGFEFGRGHYYRVIPSNFDPTAPAAAERLHSLFYRPLNLVSKSFVAKFVRRRPFLTEAFRRYLSWASAHPEPGLDFRDQFHLDQRPGCWVGTIEQALDLTETVRISIANCHHVFSLMNSATIHQRLTGEYQRVTIETLTPALAAFPFNPTSMSRRISARVVRLTGIASKGTALLARTGTGETG